MPHPPQNRYFYNLLIQYADQKSLKKGQILHAHIIKIPYLSSCSYLANNLIKFYAKCGHLHGAKLVFENLKHKNVVSYNCLIHGLSHNGSKGSTFVLELFRRMIANNILPDAHTFPGVFTAAALNLGCNFYARQVHVLGIKTASIDDVFVGSSLVNFYCKVGCVFEARKLFDRMPERNLVSWTTMISGYASKQMAKEALGVFGLMRLVEGNLNEFVFTSVLSALACPEFVDSGKQVHCVVVKNGVLGFVSVLNALVTMYAKCGNLNYSLMLFERCSDKNAITWSALITGYSQAGDSHKALKLFSKMHYAGFVPSEFTLVGVLKACSDVAAIEEGKQTHGYLLKSGYETQIYTATALVAMYAKFGFTGDARKGFDFLREPDLVLWTSIIAGYVQNGKNEEALSMYGRMQMCKILPNELTMASVLKACSNLAALEQGKQIHARAIKYGLGPELSIRSALSTMYSKCGSLEEGFLIFRRMLQRDIASWNAMISGLSQNGHGREALEIFEEMRLEGTKPDHITFVTVLSACSHMGIVKRGWAYFNMMFDEFGLVPRVEHYACMVDVLSRAGKLNEAKEFIESATIDHGMCLWRILLPACRNHCNYELGAYAGEKLMELGSRESSAYVLLSSIYTAMGRLADVVRVRRMMKVRGVRKETGCSWIELKSHVHVFVVGDQMHPQIEEIRGAIWRLRKHMKDDGYRPGHESASVSV